MPPELGLQTRCCWAPIGDIANKITYALPWYISFHISWQTDHGLDYVVRATYEEMVRDKFSFFASVLDRLVFDYDETALNDLIVHSGNDTRLSAGLLADPRKPYLSPTNNCSNLC
jgi:hypothetical protein